MIMKVDKQPCAGSNRRRLLHSIKVVIGIACVGALCVTSFHYGKVESVSKLEKRIDEMNTLLDDVISDKSVVKRDVASEARPLKKRSAAELVGERPATSLGGATYTRWGRRSCPDGSRLVYEGVAAGSHYTHSGGGSDVICLDLDVSYAPGRYVENNQGSSYIYGVEYREAAWADPLLDLSLLEGGNYRLHDVPCAVCMRPATTSQVMIPGTPSCPIGWMKEYGGYVWTSAHTHAHSSPHLCVDEALEVVPGSDGDQGGGLIYMVETQCPSLQCEPYVGGRELQCVVCSI